MLAYTGTSFVSALSILVFALNIVVLASSLNKSFTRDSNLLSVSSSILFTRSLFNIVLMLFSLIPLPTSIKYGNMLSIALLICPISFSHEDTFVMLCTLQRTSARRFSGTDFSTKLSIILV